MAPPKNSAEEDDVLEFLNSLPEDNTGAPTKATVGKADEDILGFLDELEASEKKDPKKQPSKSDTKKENPAKVTTVKPELTKDTTTTSKPAVDNTSGEISNNEPVNDPITSLSNWWSSEGSAKVSSGISSFWGTAQSITEQAQKQAEDAIKKAREQSLEDNLKNAFKDIGISGVLEGDRELTQEERTRLLKLPDTKQAIQSLNKGFSLVSSQLTNVLEKIQQDLNTGDELLDITLVHDLKNYKTLSKYVRNNFEKVMQAQVDGDIFVNISESGILSSKSDESISGDKNLGLFLGKISDGEKLVQANIDSVTKSDFEAEAVLTKEGSKKEGEPQIRKSKIYIGLLAISLNKGDETQTEEEEEIIIDEYSSSSFSFTTILVDKTHNISITTRSQPFPLKWGNWLDGKFEEGESSEEVDPREWVSDWIEKGLDSTFGVLAQSYVIKRMGY